MGASALYFCVLFSSGVGAVLTSWLMGDHYSGRYRTSNSFPVLFLGQLLIYWVSYGLYWIYLYPFALSPLRRLPKPHGGGLLFGHGMAIYEQPPGVTFLRMLKTTPNTGLIYFRGFFNQDRILITQPKTIAEVLVTRSQDFEKPTMLRAFLRLFLGDGLIVSEGHEHTKQRKNLAPAFSYGAIKDLQPLFWDQADKLTCRIAEELQERRERDPCSVATVDISRWATKVTMNVIGTAAMGKDLGSLGLDTHALAAKYEDLLQPTFAKQAFFLGCMFFTPRLVLRFFWKTGYHIVRTIEDIRSLTLDFVKESREEARMANSAAKRDILSLLTRSENFSDCELVDQLLTFLTAGHETTSSAFVWTAYLLAKNADIQSELRRELQSRLERTPIAKLQGETPSNLDDLPWLCGVCNEAVRLYPSIPTIVRNSIRDTILDGQLIPAGTQVILSPWATNRDPALWGEEAHVFNPKRWIDSAGVDGRQRPNGSGGANSNYANLSFLHGPRSCIGQAFAKAELRCLISAFVLRFDIGLADPDGPIELHGVVTLKPRNAMHFILRPLSGS